MKYSKNYENAFVVESLFSQLLMAVSGGRIKDAAEYKKTIIGSMDVLDSFTKIIHNVSIDNESKELLLNLFNETFETLKKTTFDQVVTRIDSE